MTLYLANEKEWPGELHELVRNIASSYDSRYDFIFLSYKHITVFHNILYGTKQGGVKWNLSCFFHAFTKQPHNVDPTNGMYQSIAN